MTRRQRNGLAQDGTFAPGPYGSLLDAQWITVIPSLDGERGSRTTWQPRSREESSLAGRTLRWIGVVRAVATVVWLRPGGVPTPGGAEGAGAGPDLATATDPPQAQAEHVTESVLATLRDLVPGGSGLPPAGVSNP